MPCALRGSEGSLSVMTGWTKLLAAGSSARCPSLSPGCPTSHSWQRRLTVWTRCWRRWWRRQRACLVGWSGVQAGAGRRRRGTPAGVVFESRWPVRPLAGVWFPVPACSAALHAWCGLLPCPAWVCAHCSCCPAVAAWSPGGRCRKPSTDGSVALEKLTLSTPHGEMLVCQGRGCAAAAASLLHLYTWLSSEPET